MKGVQHKLFWLLLSVFIYPLSESHAQYDNIWAFGTYAGVDFNSNPPKVIQTAMQTNEGSASISDANGQLLFYTNGTDVWDRNNNIMPNGRNLPNLPYNITSSTSQGTVIVPMPGNTKQYYVFSLGCVECDSIYSGNLFYSLIDMSLNNGLGDAVMGRKGILLDKQLTEHMTAVSGDNCNILLLTLRRTGGFKAYNIDFNGLDSNATVSPSIFSISRPYYSLGIAGTMDVSPDRKKLAVAEGNLVLYDFDPATGIVSNPLVLNRAQGAQGSYGLAFSPDNSKLYASNAEFGPLVQFDLRLNDTNAIKESKIIITNNYTFAIKRGPDGKVYCVDLNNHALDVINQPNLAGTACQYVRNGLPLYSRTRAYIGLPNSATIVINKKNYSSNTDTAFCIDSLLLQPNNPNGHNYRWEDGSTNQDRYVYDSGTYWIAYQHSLPSQCDEYADTFKIVFSAQHKLYTTISYDAMCQTDTFLMQPNNLEGANYLWEDGSGAMERKINKTGTYWVSYKNDSLCTFYTDTFQITYPDPGYRVSFRTDTLICQNDTVLFKNTSNAHFNQYDWSFGDGNKSVDREPTYDYRGVGTYHVQLIGKIDGICPDTASVTLVIDPFITVDFSIDRDSICVGESITFSHQINSNTLLGLQWDFGDGMQRSDLEQNSIQHAYDHAGIMSVQLAANFRACPDTSSRDAIHVFASPKVDLGPSSGLCLKGSPILLQNLQHTEAATYLWNTGDTTAILKVVHPGVYSLKVSDAPLGCNSTEAIEIKKDCYSDIPNAFTPNGDGFNDYFFPRQLLSQKVTALNMQIFNRLGQVIFETEQIDGKGWDGRFDGKEEPQGAYIYRIEVTINSQTELYQGNVTLIR